MRTTKFLSIFTIAACFLFTSCTEEGSSIPTATPETKFETEELTDGNGNVIETITTITDYGKGLGTITLSSTTTWVLNGMVFVNNGQTLTIDEGTVIKGQSGQGENASALIIARDAKIMAYGTAANPVIMTSQADQIRRKADNSGFENGGNLPATARGLWGGLIVLGNARLNSLPGTSAIEGIPTSESRGLYGGTDDDDNSGMLHYVSVRHGGTDIGSGNEINGITLGGVGSGTVINHVEIVATLDDGIEFFGGSVNVQNALVYNHGDDGIDIDFNYSGTVNNFIVMHGGDTDEGLEIDGPEGTTNTSGLFTLKNGTIISTDGKGSAADLKSKAQGTIENCSFAGYSGKYIKFRASFGDTTNCTSKSDAYAYFIAATPKLIVKNNDLGEQPAINSQHCSPKYSGEIILCYAYLRQPH